MFDHTIACRVVMILVVLVIASLRVDAGVTDKDFYPILPWGPINFRGNGPDEAKAQLRSIAACNFTVAGFVLKEDLNTCREFGLKAIIREPREKTPWSDKWLNLSDETIDASIRAWIEDIGTHDVILGYYLTDEPGTPKFPALAAGVAAVKKYAPGKLAYINLFPGYATIGAPDKSQLGANSFTEYLEKYVDQVNPQFLSYDNYQIFTSDDMQKKDASAGYFRDLLEVRRVSKEHELPFWNIACSNQIRNFTTIPSPANLMMQAYTTLAAGARGLSWYTYYKGGYDYAPIDNENRRTDTWYYLQNVNRQVKVLGPMMNRMESTGVYFTDPAPSKSMPVLPGGLVESIQSRSSIRITDAEKLPLMIGEFKGEDGNDYVMVVNLSLEKSVNFLMKTKKEYSKKETISAQDGSASPLDETNGQWLVAGQGALVRLVE